MGGQRNRTTFAKLQRERARMEKQRLKREKKLEKGDAPAEPEEEQSAYWPGEGPPSHAPSGANTD